MKRLNSLAEAALEFVAVEVGMVEALHRGLEAVARRVEKTAKDEIGEYQSAIAPFPAWAPLAASTETEKRRLGYPADAPLLRTGDMRASVGHEVEALEAVIGATDPVMIYHEFGTAKMPPRPVMGPAALHNRAIIEKLLGAATVSGLLGGAQIGALGYDFETER